MNSEPAFLDVNIPMYAAGQPHPLKEACVWIMTEIAYGGLMLRLIRKSFKRFCIGMAHCGGGKTAVSLFNQYAPKGVKVRGLL